MTIKAKITIAQATAFGAVLVAFAFIMYRSSYNAELSKLDAYLTTHGQKLETEIEEQHDEGLFPDLRELSALRTEGLAIRYQLYDSAGSLVVADSLLPPVQAVASHLRASPELSTVGIKGETFRSLIMPIEVDDRPLYVLELVTPTAPVESTLRRLQLMFLITIPITLLAASVASYLITRVALRPVTRMVESANTFSAENLSPEVQLPAAHDEMHLLGQTMNAMMERIGGAFNSQRQFVADASHELRTPLAVLCSELEYAQQKVSDPEVQESIRIALGEVDRLAKMTDGLLLLSKLDVSRLSVKNEPVRLDELLMDCMQLLRGVSVQSGVSLDLHVEGPAEVTGDADRLKCALLNILDNALKYSPAGSRVSVSLACSHGMAQMSIRDSGCGIPEGELPKIFERFYRASTTRGETAGSGLGLAIVDRIVRMHRGTVTIESEVRKGTTVTVNLPLSAILSSPFHVR